MSAVAQGGPGPRLDHSFEAATTSRGKLPLSRDRGEGRNTQIKMTGGVGARPNHRGVLKLSRTNVAAFTVKSGMYCYFYD